jgi:hypothetical protein
MSKLVLTNPSITINSVDLTGYINEVTIDMSFDEVESTAFGNTVRQRLGGLGDHSVSLSMHQSYAASLVEQTVYPLLNGTTNIVVKAVNTTTSTTNPSYTCVALVSQWQPVNGAVGDLATADVTWPCNSVTKATS